MVNTERILDNSRYGIAPFSVWYPLQKGLLTEDEREAEHRFAFSGPLSHPHRDIQGDEIRVVQKGLEYLTQIGGPVDWEHIYETRKDPDALIGEGTRIWQDEHPDGGEQVLFMNTDLFPPAHKPLVMKAVNHYRSGGKLGYSVAGGGVRESDTGRIIPVVTTVGMTIKPVQTKNSGCLHLVKSLMRLEELGVDDLCPGMLPWVPETWDQVGPLLALQFRSVLKSMDCDPGSLPHMGPGADALSVEDLAGRRRKKKRPAARAELGQQLQKALLAQIANGLAHRLALA